jgi:hypothetical protein
MVVASAKPSSCYTMVTRGEETKVEIAASLQCLRALDWRVAVMMKDVTQQHIESRPTHCIDSAQRIQAREKGSLPWSRGPKSLSSVLLG